MPAGRHQNLACIIRFRLVHRLHVISAERISVICIRQAKIHIRPRNVAIFTVKEIFRLVPCGLVVAANDLPSEKHVSSQVVRRKDSQPVAIAKFDHPLQIAKRLHWRKVQIGIELVRRIDKCVQLVGKKILPRRVFSPGWYVAEDVKIII